MRKWQMENSHFARKYDVQFRLDDDSERPVHMCLCLFSMFDYYQQLCAFAFITADVFA